MTSGESVSVACCRYCGKEFDVRRFQVVVMGNRGVYDSSECALLDARGKRRAGRPLVPHTDAGRAPMRPGWGVLVAVAANVCVAVFSLSGSAYLWAKASEPIVQPQAVPASLRS